VSEPRPLNEILRTVVGSGLHGIAIEGTDDHDEMGVFIEPPEVVLGLEKPLDHDVWRTQPEGKRSGPGDTDLVRYSLRKYLRLSVQGNPTILLPLFAPIGKIQFANAYGWELIHLRSAIVSQRAGPRFLGYMDAQVARLEGRRSLPTTRTELIAKHGYDTKFAAHALRLAIQGIELLRDGWISLPMQEPDLGEVRAIKEGLVSKESVLIAIADARKQLVELLDRGLSSIRPEPDLVRINRWSVAVHRGVWWGRENLDAGG
jgi:hypothetical protein